MLKLIEKRVGAGVAVRGGAPSRRSVLWAGVALLAAVVTHRQRAFRSPRIVVRGGWIVSSDD